MNKDIFQYRDYKNYLGSIIASRPGRGRGMRSAIAEALSCQTSYVSQVLNGEAHFSLEQGDILNRFFGHSSEESGFFLLLIQLARAGTASLEKHWERQIDLILERRLVLKERLDVKRTLSREDQAVYYSSWLYSAVHIMLTVPKFRGKAAIAEHLGVSVAVVSEIMEFLVSIGLAKDNRGSFTVGESQIYLGSDSPLISKHHINWRVQAIRAVEKERLGDNLHYSSTWSVSEKDFTRIKGKLIEDLDGVRTALKASKEEQVVCLNIDYFKI